VRLLGPLHIPACIDTVPLAQQFRCGPRLKRGVKRLLVQENDIDLDWNGSVQFDGVEIVDELALRIGPQKREIRQLPWCVPLRRGFSLLGIEGFGIRALRQPLHLALTFAVHVRSDLDGPLVVLVNPHMYVGPGRDADPDFENSNLPHNWAAARLVQHTIQLAAINGDRCAHLVFLHVTFTFFVIRTPGIRRSPLEALATAASSLVFACSTSFWTLPATTARASSRISVTSTSN